MHSAVLILLVGCCAWLSGCALVDRPGEDILHVTALDSPDERDCRQALEKFRQAERQMDHGFVGIAEKLLQEAIQLNPALGPAHNNLGLIYLSRRQLYEAAHAFDTACVTMPNSPIPENNLGLTLEEGGKLEEAIEHYGRAHFLAPANPEFLGNLVRARRIRGDNTDDVASMLQELVYLETRPDWVEWAQDELNLVMPLEHQVLPAANHTLGPYAEPGKTTSPPPLPAPPPELVPPAPDQSFKQGSRREVGTAYWSQCSPSLCQDFKVHGNRNCRLMAELCAESIEQVEGE